MKKVIILLSVIIMLTGCKKEDESPMDYEALVFGNQWVAAFIRFENGDSSTPDVDYYFTIYEETNQFGLQLDWNVCGGEIHFRNNRVFFKGYMVCTMICCDSEFAEALAGSLTKTKYWRIQGNQLVLFNNNGLLIGFNKK